MVIINDPELSHTLNTSFTSKYAQMSLTQRTATFKQQSYQTVAEQPKFTLRYFLIETPLLIERMCQQFEPAQVL